MKIFLADKARLFLLWVMKFIIRRGPKFLRRLAARVPRSRFHKMPRYLFFGKKKMQWRGVTVKVNISENYGYYLYFFNAYADEEIKKLIEACKGARIFADVGANTGLFSLAIARACPGLEVFAFEPAPDVAAEFRDNLYLNPDLSTKVNLIESAVADAEKNIFFQPTDDPENKMAGRLVDIETPYAVKAVRLDKFFESIGKEPDVVKIDVEGAEYRVLEGMRGIFNKGYPKIMLIEIHSFYHSDVLTYHAKIKKILEAAHFSIFQLENEKLKNLGHIRNWPTYFHILAIRNNYKFL